MENNKTAGLENYAGILRQVGVLLNLSLSEIKDKYADYPHCLTDYIEKGITEKSIEIRFDKDEMTMTCLFNTEEKCNCIFLFADNNRTIEEFIRYLMGAFDYCYLRSRWKATGYYIKVKEVCKFYDDFCLVMYC